MKKSSERAMRKSELRHEASSTFAAAAALALALPDVAATTKYDGSPVLRARGAFMAGVATHPSAEPDSLVVRIGLEEREGLLEDAPEIYYLTDYYERHPVVLVRLSRIDRAALRDLLSVSRRRTLTRERVRARARD
jgi:hypothetical protein